MNRDKILEGIDQCSSLLTENELDDILYKFDIYDYSELRELPTDSLLEVYEEMLDELKDSNDEFKYIWMLVTDSTLSREEIGWMSGFESALELIGKSEYLDEINPSI